MLRKKRIPVSVFSVELERPAYRGDIDGLRAIAVMAVVLFHAFPQLCPGGFIGVDIFFVISGYLISKLICANLKHGSFTLGRFYLRRIRRIVPALAVMLTVVLAIGTIVLLNDEYQQLGKYIAASSGFVTNIALWRDAGYFDNSAPTKPLLHLWSLGVEEQFYITWPLLLLIAWRRRWNLFLIGLTVAAISFGLNVAAVRNHPTATFYLPATRLWELMLGAVLAFGTLAKQLEPIPPAPNALAVVGSGLIGVGLIAVKGWDFYPGWWALLPTIGTALLIAAGARAAVNRLILSNRFLVGIGLISYPIYLWHWPLFSFARIIEGKAPAPATAAILILVSAALAWLTYRFVELPVRRAPRIGWMVAALCASLLFIGCTGYTAFWLTGVASDQFVGPLWKYTKNDTCLQRYPFKEADGYAWWFCMQNRSADPTVLLFGDSYANALYPGFAHNDALKTQTILSIGDCGPYEDSVDASNPCFGHRFFDQRKFINRIIALDKSLKYVIMNYQHDINGSVELSERHIAEILASIDFVEQHGATPIVFVWKLELPYDIKSCVPRLSWFFATHSCEMDIGDRAKLDRSFKPLLDRLQKRHVLVFDQNELFCDSDKCSMTRNGIPLLRDEFGHLSEYGSTLLGRLFVRWATTNAPGLVQ